MRLLCFIYFLLYCGYAIALEKKIPDVKIAASDPAIHLVLVPKETSSQELRDLLTAVSCSRKSGKLMEIGIPPTTPKGKMGPYAIVNLYIFKDPSYATLEKYKKWLNTDENNPFNTQFGQKIEGYYHSSPGQEVISIGYEDGGRPFTRSYAALSSVDDLVCRETQFTLAGPKENEFDMFIKSEFARKYGLQQSKSWALNTGDTNIDFKSTTLPVANVSLRKKGNAVRGFSVSFRVGYSLADPELDLAKELVEFALKKEATMELWSFVRSNLEKPIVEKKDPNNPMEIASSSYFSRSVGHKVVRAGKHGGDPTLIIDRDS